MSMASKGRRAQSALLFLCALTGVSGCASHPSQPVTLSEQKRLVVREEYQKCYRDLLREAWRKKWDEQYMDSEIERMCSHHVGRPYYREAIPPRLSLY